MNLDMPVDSCVTPPAWVRGEEAVAAYRSNYREFERTMAAYSADTVQARYRDDVSRELQRDDSGSRL
uniref:Uncharacterized protein n=1 Tax=Candidatus Kentrum sp. LFY TaxID=2126342 RepID=A0A450WGY7_9GAMM|nr:MAG: hypothetical protein BECKLFY1418C_GA0070996_102221 [Candidatus Kentron sp. LFY]